MPVEIVPLVDKTQTGRAMHRLVERFAGDLDRIFVRGYRFPLSRWPLPSYHEFVKYIPYRIDTPPREVVVRPKKLLGEEIMDAVHNGADCKKKAILMASWARRNRVPYRLMASSNRPDRIITHTYPEFKIAGEWVNMDATYRWHKLGERKRNTATEILPRGRP
jgi:hypothetical protein